MEFVNAAMKYVFNKVQSKVFVDFMENSGIFKLIIRKIRHADIDVQKVHEPPFHLSAVALCPTYVLALNKLIKIFESRQYL